MKNIILKTVVFALVTLFMSCGKDTKEQKESAPQVNQTKNEPATNSVTDLNKTNAISQVSFSDESVSKIYTQYLLVKKALVNTDDAAVQKAANNLEQLSGDSEGNKGLKATAKLIAVTKNIDKQRDFFVSLTNEMEKIITSSEVTSGEIYKQYCPMAFNNEGGYWLSDSKEIRNPYFGNRMLKCGEVKEVLK